MYPWHPQSLPTPIISGKVFLLLYSFLPRILYLNMSLQILGKHHWKRWTLLSHWRQMIVIFTYIMCSLGYRVFGDSFAGQVTNAGFYCSLKMSDQLGVRRCLSQQQVPADHCADRKPAHVLVRHSICWPSVPEAACLNRDGNNHNVLYPDDKSGQLGYPPLGQQPHFFIAAPSQLSNSKPQIPWLSNEPHKGDHSRRCQRSSEDQ